MIVLIGSSASKLPSSATFSQVETFNQCANAYFSEYFSGITSFFSFFFIVLILKLIDPFLFCKISLLANGAGCSWTVCGPSLWRLVCLFHEPHKSYQKNTQLLQSSARLRSLLHVVFSLLTSCSWSLQW